MSLEQIQIDRHEDESAPHNSDVPRGSLIEDDDMQTQCDGDPLAPEGWQVTNEGQADWAARKILDARAHVDRLEAGHRVRMAQARNERDRAESFFAPMLEGWAAGNLVGKRRSVDVPSARLAFRAVPGGFRVTDRELAAKWARATFEPAFQAAILQRIEHEAQRKYNEVVDKALANAVLDGCEERVGRALGEAWAAVTPDIGNEAALTMAEQRAREAIPPGVEKVPDRESFSVKEPRGAK